MLAVTPLERRTLPAGGPGVFAHIAGQVSPHQATGSTRLSIDPDDFTSPRDRVLLGLVADVEGSDLKPRRLRVVSLTPAANAGLAQQAVASAGNASLTLTSVTPGSYSAVVAPRAKTHGPYDLEAYLAGDVNDDFRVDQSDLAIIRSLRGVRRSSGRYLLGVDVNRDGVINNTDLSLARRNLGVSTSIRPIAVSAELDPAANPGGDDQISTPTVVVMGQTEPGALIRVDAGDDGTIDQLLSADAQGIYRFSIDASPGVNDLAITATDRFGQAATANLVFTRIVASSGTQPITPTQPAGGTQPPSIVISSPTAGTTTNTNVTIVGHVADATSGVTSLVARVDSGGEISIPFDAASGNFTYTTALALDGTADGGHQVQLVATDEAGDASTLAPFGFTLDTRPPVVMIQTQNPTTASTTNVTIAGHVTDATSGVASLTSSLDGGSPQAVGVDAAGNFTLMTALPLDGTADGGHRVQLVATDGAGNSSPASSFVFTLDTRPPTVTIQSPDQNAASRSDPTITGLVADATSGVATLFAQVDAGVAVPVSFDASGAFRFTPTLATDGTADGAHTIQFTATDAAGLSSQPVSLTFRLDQTALPDPSTIAPALSSTATTSLLDATSFLYTGPEAIQLGVAAGTIAPDRAAVVRGKVLDQAGNPLAGATITVLDHPEYGLTYSRADGMLDLAVNGGGPLTIEYAKAGYLPIERQIDVPWQDYAVLPDVAMSPLDSQVTAIDLTSTQPFQVARGSVESDGDGTRQATLLFPQGELATMTLANGTTQALTSLDVRATEYTVGPNGPEAMPGNLPPTSGYTYAVELSDDAAVATGATTVSFSKAVPFYLENFLNFPVGMSVPTGYFDRQSGQWVASANGQVVKVLSETAGTANLDVDGNGTAATASELATLGITDAERTQIAALYKVGQSLWRVPISHFTPWDCNWPIGAPQGAPSPDLDPNSLNDGTQDNPSQACGASVIGVENQTLGESIPIAGTPFSLDYQSDRTIGGSVSDRTLTVPLTGGTYSNDLRGISLTVAVAGREFMQDFTPSANLSTTFTWDGLDAYGRPIQGKVPVVVYVGYSYDAFYYQPGTVVQSFAVESSGPLLSVPARREITLNQTIHTSLESYSLGASGLGGWSLDAQQSYDPVGQVLHGGNGTDRSGTGPADNIITTVAGNGVFTDFRNTGDGGPATQASINPYAVAVGPDGTLYIVSGNQIRHVASNGIITTIAGNGQYAYSGDGGPALQAGMSPVALAFGPDGSLYFADNDGHSQERIRRIAPNGIVTTVAGNGIETPDGSLGDGGPATRASFFGVDSIAVAGDGTLYICDSGDHRIRRVGTDGIITTVAGDGGYQSGGLGGPATKADLGDPSSIALGPDGSLYIADGRIFVDNTQHDRILRVGTDGIISLFAGNQQYGSYSGDGGLATNAIISQPGPIAVGADGSVYISLQERVLRVAPNGIVTTYAGNGTEPYIGTGTQPYNGDGGPATGADMSASGLALSPDGSLYLIDLQGQSGSVRRVSKALPGVSQDDILIPSQDGSQLYEFDFNGRHLETVDALTGALIYAFGYDSAGRLTSVTDGDGNVTSIQRDAAGDPIAIVAPHGQRTILTVNAQGYLASVADPAGEATTLGYGTGGLLTSKTDPIGNASSMTYDASGRLILDDNAADGFTRLDRTEMGGGSYKVTTTNAVAGTRQYLVEQLASGAEERTSIDGRGFQTVSLQATDGTTRTTAPDGTTRTTVLGPDPRFGMLAPVVTSQSVQLPSGLTSTTTDDRTDSYGTINGSLALTNLTDAVSTNGNTSTTIYDGTNRTITDTSAAGRASVTTLDGEGRVVLVQVPGVAATRFAYNTSGQLASVNQGDRTVTYGYDARGDLAQITDPLQRTVTFAYDAADRLIRQVQPDQSVITFAYDAAGNMIGLTPPGEAETTFGYDAVDHLTTVTPPAVSSADDSTRYTYNLAGQVIQQSLPDGSDVLYAYCDCGRLNSITTPLGTYGYTYSQTTGALTSLSSPGGAQLAYGYDGELPTSTTLSGPVAGTVSWTYNADFQITSESVDGGNTVNYGYDTDGLLTQAGALTLTRDAATGFLTGTTLGTVTDTLAYNAYGEASTYQAKIGQDVAFEDDFTRDQLGRISRKVETIGGITTTTDYRYDLDDRLITVTENGVLTQQYGYDANGNRLSLTTASGTETGTYDAQDQLLTYGTKTYSYTTAGQLVQVTDSATGETTHYTYDVFGNLTRVDLPTGHTVEYLTDGQDRRIGEKVDGVLTEGLIYRGQLQPAAETDGSGNIVERFVYGVGINVPEYMVKGGMNYRLITDQLGSVRLVINTATGQIAQRIDYDAFGRIVLDTNPGFQPFGFAGGLYDSSTGLVRFGARDYDAINARWLTPDPLNFGSGSTNNYSYSNENPLNQADPYGFSSSSVCSESNPNGLSDLDKALNGFENGLNTFADGAALAAAIIALIATDGASFAIDAEIAEVEAEAAASAEADASASAINPNDLSHVFDNPAHNLDNIVNQYGSQENAYNAIQEATQQVVNETGTTNYVDGIVVNVGGQNVTVRGVVVDGVARIGTAYIPK